MKKLKKKRSFRRFATVERDFYFAIFVIFGSKVTKSKKINFQNPDSRWFRNLGGRFFSAKWGGNPPDYPPIPLRFEGVKTPDYPPIPFRFGGIISVVLALSPQLGG